jgi:hypothetical protein
MRKDKIERKDLGIRIIRNKKYNDDKQNKNK